MNDWYDKELNKDMYDALKELVRITEGIKNCGGAYSGLGAWQSSELQTARLEAEQVLAKAKGEVV